MKLAPGAVIAGRYRLEKRLAVGGMGSLWTAQHTQLETHVAIKFMDPNHAGSAMGRQRFEREAKMAASLKSAHVVQVHDYGVEEDRPYIVMELLQGEDLGKRLKRERRLSLQVTSGILMQIARGLRRAHDAGLVHRDLKPPNIFMARGDDDEVVKILDFGIAKDTMESKLGEGTKTGELMGSPHFMSPEQIRGSRDIDHRSDLWSLGVILFRAVTGALPFQGDAIGAVIAHILADPIPAPSSVYPSLSPAVDAYFARAFSRDREARFQSAREMAETFAALAVEASAAPAGGSPSVFPAPDSGLAGTAALFTPAPFTPSPFTPRPSAAALDPMTAPIAVRRIMPSDAPMDLVPAPRPMPPSASSFPPTPPPNDPLFTPRPRQDSSTADMTASPDSHSTATPGGGGISSTGGPLIQSAIPPPLRPARSGAVWLGAGAVAVLLVGSGIAFVARGSSSPASAARPAAIEGASDPAPSASAPPPPSSAPVAASSAPAEPAPSAAAAMPATSASAAVKSATAMTTKVTPAPSGSVKKKPTWGF